MRSALGTGIETGWTTPVRAVPGSVRSGEPNEPMPWLASVTRSASMLGR